MASEVRLTHSNDSVNTRAETSAKDTTSEKAAAAFQDRKVFNGAGAGGSDTKLLSNKVSLNQEESSLSSDFSFTNLSDFSTTEDFSSGSSESSPESYLTPLSPRDTSSEIKTYFIKEIRTKLSLDIFQQIPPNKLHCLFIDAKRWEEAFKNPLLFDVKEPGYLEGMYAGYLHMLQTMDKPLTSGLYREFHDLVSKGTYSNEQDEIPSGFRTHKDGIEAFQVIIGDTLSQEGYDELLERFNTYQFSDSETGDVHYFLKEAMFDPRKTIDFSGERLSFIRLKPTRPETAAANVAACIRIFQEKPKETEEQKLLAIAGLCQDLDQLHVFVDGNIRTAGILLLNRLLIEEGLTPCCLTDPNCLDGLSRAQLVEKIREGQENFLSLRHLKGGLKV